MARRKQFAVLSSILADTLGTENRSRRRRNRPDTYNKQHAASVAIQALFEYLADTMNNGHPEEAKRAAQFYDELQGIDEDRILSSIQSLQNLLIEKQKRGQQIYSTLWRRAPHNLGIAYGKYLVTANPDIVVEDLFESYIETKTS